MHNIVGAPYGVPIFYLYINKVRVIAFPDCSRSDTFKDLFACIYAFRVF